MHRAILAAFPPLVSEKLFDRLVAVSGGPEAEGSRLWMEGAATACEQRRPQKITFFLQEFTLRTSEEIVEADEGPQDSYELLVVSACLRQHPSLQIVTYLFEEEEVSVGMSVDFDGEDIALFGPAHPGDFLVCTVAVFELDSEFDVEVLTGLKPEDEASTQETFQAWLLAHFADTPVLQAGLGCDDPSQTIRARDRSDHMENVMQLVSSGLAQKFNGEELFRTTEAFCERDYPSYQRGPSFTRSSEKISAKFIIWDESEL